MLSMTRPLNDEDRKLVQQYVDEAFERFKDIVKQGRPAFRADPDTLDQLATGEIFSATQAKDHGLVDEIGFIESAIDRAMELARLDRQDTRVVQYKRQASLFDLPMFVQPAGSATDVARLFDLATPQAYYLATTLPCMATHRIPDPR
jgi:protease-4